MIPIGTITISNNVAYVFIIDETDDTVKWRPLDVTLEYIKVADLDDVLSLPVTTVDVGTLHSVWATDFVFGCLNDQMGWRRITSCVMDIPVASLSDVIALCEDDPDYESDSNSEEDEELTDDGPEEEEDDDDNDAGSGNDELTHHKKSNQSRKYKVIIDDSEGDPGLSAEMRQQIRELATTYGKRPK